jgi:hypothetical protein
MRRGRHREHTSQRGQQEAPAVHAGDGGTGGEPRQAPRGRRAIGPCVSPSLYSANAKSIARSSSAKASTLLQHLFVLRLDDHAGLVDERARLACRVGDAGRVQLLRDLEDAGALGCAREDPADQVGLGLVDPPLALLRVAVVLVAEQASVVQARAAFIRSTFFSDVRDEAASASCAANVKRMLSIRRACGVETSMGFFELYSETSTPALSSW